MSRCATEVLPIAVAFLDLDNFKPVNDSLGHPAGDGVLRAIGSLLNRVVAGRGMIVGRYGGDESVVAAPNCTAVELHAIAERVLNVIATDQHCEPAPGLRIGYSIGIACAAGNKTTPADLIKTADAACYAAKRAGKARIVNSSDENSEVDARGVVEIAFAFQGTLALQKNSRVTIRQWRHHPGADAEHFEAQVVEVSGGTIQRQTVGVMSTLTAWKGSVPGTVSFFEQIRGSCTFRLTVARTVYEEELEHSVRCVP